MYGVIRQGVRLLFLLFSLAALQSLQAAGTLFPQGLLFKIERAGQPVAYLFGTIHSEDPRVLALPPAVEEAFSSSHTLCLEVDMSPSNLLASMTSMFLQDERQLPDIVGRAFYARLVQTAVRRGIPEVSLRYYKPWAIAVILAMPPVVTGEFLDLVLYQRAIQANKQVIGLESVAEQLDLFDGLPEADQVNLLKETLNNIEELPIIFQALLETYLERDLAGLMEINRQLLQDVDPRFSSRFQDRLLDQRNLRMVERLQAPLIAGDLFVAVGALHLPGERGMLRLLQEQGYRVVRIY